MRVRITHLSFSRSGGAGQVANTLSHQQNILGQDSNFHYLTESNLRQDLAHNFNAAITAGIDNFVIRSPRHGSLVSITRDLVRGLNPDSVPGGDVLHLHWINGLGQSSIEELSKRFKSVFFTLHDMNPLTSVCHQSLACSGYLNSCQDGCPAVRRPFKAFVPKLFEKKLDFLSRLKNLTIIAPSRWLEGEASKVLKDSAVPIRYLPNPVNPSIHESAKKTLTLRSIERTTVTFGFIATDLRDSNKGFVDLLKAFNVASASRRNIRLVAAGAGDSQYSGPSVHFLGPLGIQQLSDFYSSIDILVIPSLAENAPLVAAEAACFGKRILMRDIPAARDLAELKNLVRVDLFKDDDHLIESLLRFSSSSLDSDDAAMQSTALDFYDPRNSAVSHVKLYTDSIWKLK